MVRDTNGPTIDDLKSDMAQLQDDILALSQTVKDLVAAHGAEGVSRAKDTASKVRTQADETAALVGQEISNRPFTSVLVAFGIGYLFGKLFERR